VQTTTLAKRRCTVYRIRHCPLIMARYVMWSLRLGQAVRVPLVG
jgi:hypothetical protein